MTRGCKHGGGAAGGPLMGAFAAAAAVGAMDRPDWAMYDRVDPWARRRANAAHPWDVHGAGSVGPAAGFVPRGLTRPPAMTAPDVGGTESADVARDPARARR